MPYTEEDQAQYNVTRLRKEREVSEAFLSYLSSKGPFEDWETNKESFRQVHVSIYRYQHNINTHILFCKGENPITMWSAFLHTPPIHELADFAIRLLCMSVNQAGLERNFSDLKIKKTRLRNRMTIPRLEKMAKVSLFALGIC